jgi:hypothetical protein
MYVTFNLDVSEIKIFRIEMSFSGMTVNPILIKTEKRKTDNWEISCLHATR